MNDHDRNTKSNIMSREEYATAIAKTQPQWDRMTAHAKAGTPYHVSEQELQILQDPSFGPSSRGWRSFPEPASMNHAHAALKDAMYKRPSWAQVAARQRLLDSHNAPYGTRSPGLLIKIINDIDTVLFAGTLRNRMLIHWIDHSIFTRKLHSAAGKDKEADKKSDTTPTSLATTVIPPKRFRDSVRPAIYLSAEIMCLAAQSRVHPLALLIHEMLHVYFSLVGRHDVDGGQTDESDDQGTAATDHDRFFEATCDVLATRLGFRGLSGRTILHYYKNPHPVQLSRVNERRKVTLGDGLTHNILLPR